MSFLLVVAGMFSILAMAALAVDVVTIYLARSEAQKAADAGALAAAKAFVLSGITSGSGLSNICGGATDASNKLGQTVAAANQLGGVSAQVTNVNCNLTNLQNPQVTVTVARTDLPTFFGRIFGQRTASVSAKATAEAFNNSGSSVPIQVGSVKPWFIPNCNPTMPLTGTPPCGGPFFINSGSGYTSQASYIGQAFQFKRAQAALGQSYYYPIDTSQMTHASICPSAASIGCPASIGTGTPGTPAGYIDDIACANPTPMPGPPPAPMTCGARLPIALATNYADTVTGTQCLIHTNNPMSGGQDIFHAGTPVTIDGGDNNPNPGLRDQTNISRSDSVVTVPVFDWNGNPCPGGVCAGNLTVIGFLQLGITNVDTTDGDLNTVVMNIVGCNPGASGTGVSGGALTPMPVRLVQ